MSAQQTLVSKQLGIDPRISASSGKGQTILILAPYPYSLFIPPVLQGLEACGAEVRTAGPGWKSPHWDAAKYERYVPRDRHGFFCDPDSYINDIIDHWPTPPTAIVYFEPTRAFLPRGIDEIDLPTAIVLGEDRIHADLHSTLIPLFDRVLTAFEPTSEIYRSRGVDNVFNWYLAPIPDFIYDKKTPRNVDVAFWGNLQPQVQRRRNKVIEELLDVGNGGYTIVVGMHVYFDDYNDRLNEAKIIVHDSVTRQLNMRVLEGMAAGCLVVAARPQSFDDYAPRQFVEGQHLVYFDDIDHAKELIRHFLANPQERDAIAANGRKRALEAFTPEILARQLIVDHLNQIPHDHLRLRRRRIQAWEYSIPEARVRYFVQSWDPGTARSNAAGPSTHRLQNDLAVGDANLQRFRDSILRLETVLNDHPDMAVARANLVAIKYSTESGDNWARHAAWIEEQIDRLRSVQPDRLQPADLEAAYFPIEYQRFRLETADAFYDSTGETRAKRLLDLQLYRTHLYAAAAYMKARGFDEAIEHYRAALSIVPDDGMAMASLAVPLSQQHRFAESCALLQQATAVEPFFVDAQFRLFRLFTAARRMDDAAEILRKIASNPWAPPDQRETALEARGRIIDSQVLAAGTVRG